MKKKSISILLIILIFPIVKAFACSCSILATTTSYYQTADFVGVIKILKNYKNLPDTNEYYKADIEILDLYKGKTIKSLYILGNNGGSTYNSCGTFIKEGEIRLVFGNFTKNSFISTYLCTSYQNPNAASYRRDQIQEKLTILNRFARKHTIKIYNEAAIYISDFKKIKKPDSINYFSIIRIKLTKDGTIKNMINLTNDNKALRNTYNQYFRNTFSWQRLNQIRKNNEGELTIFFEINPYKS